MSMLYPQRDELLLWLCFPALAEYGGHFSRSFSAIHLIYFANFFPLSGNFGFYLA
ncbi:MAG: hypothetical protein U5L01_12955 [Rheinheimera sp.]|nr:hypothetical protein [Rheinheimera sp.]